MERVSGVFLTDSVHFGLTGHDELDTKLKAVGVNYVSSDQPLGMDVNKGQKEGEKISKICDKKKKRMKDNVNKIRY